MSQDKEHLKYSLNSQNDDIQIRQNSLKKPLMIQDMDDSVTSDEEKKEDIPKTSFRKLFKFATKVDYFLMSIGLLSSMVNGLAFPMFSLIFGEMTDSFSPTSSGDDIVSAVGQQSLYFLYIGIGSFFLSWIQMSTWMISGERQSIQFRKNYFKAVMSQEVGWFDMVNPNELSSKIAQECFQIQGAIGEKVPIFFMTIFMTLGGFGVGYIRGWQMALVSTAALPVVTIGAVAFAFVIQTSQKKISGAYQTAGGLAEQALSNIKTVKSLTGEEFELENYKVNLLQALKTACKYGLWAGAGLGLTFAAMFLDYALSFWYGSKLIDDQTINTTMGRVYTQGDIFVVFFAIMIGGFSMGQMGPCLKNFAIGMQAGKKVFDIIERTPEILIPINAKQIPNLQGKVEFKSVDFNYPAKPDIPVIKQLNLTINPNETTALVGESGCGKSTIMQLLLRFYDPQQGSVLIDGQDVRTLDFNWLRKNVGYVGQEPVLFAASIRENLRFGKENATDKEMIEALKQANAWEFVQDLENQLDTYVGNAGSQISGGQKQRICIARAILKNPQILLLDEATSALDRKNEAIIQKTLDEISKGRTTIVIAHRLSTIRNADRILVLEQGQLVEQGKYDQLINAKGKFEALTKNQIQKDQDFGSEDILRNEEQEHHSNASMQNQNNGSHLKQNGKLPSAQIPEQPTEKVVLSKEEQKKLDAEEKGMLKRLQEINKPEQKFLFFGSFFALANGVMFPLSGLILGEYVNVLSKPDSSDFRSDANMLSLCFVFIAIGAQIFSIFQQYLFTRVGEGLTLRIRQETFAKMVKMPGGWFDKVENNPATLGARLSVDAHIINGLTSNIISIQIQNASALLTGLTIAFVNSWSMSLIAIGISPLMVISGYMQTKFAQGFSENSDSAYKESGQIIMESVTNIRTVVSFANEKKIEYLFAEKLKQPYEIAFKKGLYTGGAFGFSQFVVYGVYAVIFISGALLVRSDGLSIKAMFNTIFGILFAAFGAGSSSQFMTDIGAAKAACKNIFKILDSEDELQVAENYQKGTVSVKEKVIGDIEFRNVTFKYPTRDALVFNNISFTIKSGQKVAFVGSSGSGKSTIFQLLLRFYDNYEGQILVDGQDIRNYDIREFRRSFGVVSQEPILFNGTIKENIQYNSQVVFIDEIKEAARKANALQFIEQNAFDTNDDSNNRKNDKTLGTGFNRKVGLKGSQISGGQKQRIAIARAIIKNPNILLLDEATSALDQQNERIVQESLNQLMKGKTSLCVAHRISTIQDSDTIFVIEAGKLVEQGTYDYLIAQKQYFYRLNKN